MACVNIRGRAREVHGVDDGLQLVELGRQGLGRADTVGTKTVYRRIDSTRLVWAYEQGLVGYPLGGRQAERRNLSCDHGLHCCVPGIVYGEKGK